MGLQKAVEHYRRPRHSSVSFANCSDFERESSILVQLLFVHPTSCYSLYVGPPDLFNSTSAFVCIKKHGILPIPANSVSFLINRSFHKKCLNLWEICRSKRISLCGLKFIKKCTLIYRLILLHDEISFQERI